MWFGLPQFGAMNATFVPQRNRIHSMRFRMLKPAQLVLVAVLGSFFAPSASAHSGGLNSEGCHNDRKNGGYHCHRAATPAPLPTYDASGGDEPFFPNCDAARAAGVAPIYYGEPGYRGRLDRDQDGIACE